MPDYEPLRAEAGSVLQERVIPTGIKVSKQSSAPRTYEQGIPAPKAEHNRSARPYTK